MGAVVRNVILLGAAGLLLAAGLCGADKPAQPLDRTVAAQVAGEPIYAREVAYALRQALPGKRLTPAELPVAREQMLRQLIDRRLVVRALERSGQAASEQDVDYAQQQLVKRLQAREISLAEHLQALGRSADDWRREAAWKLSWQRYLDRHLTAENLQKYFERHRREFDGTQLRVAHILLKANVADASQLAAAQQRARDILREVRTGKLSFADAARQYSQGPSAAAGGDIGLIQRRRPMPESFSRAAFALEKGGISEPVVTDFGVHLIQCLEIEPGQRTWQDAGPELQLAATEFLFHRLADRERPGTKIEMPSQENKPQ
jgi:parvulin-like peptidyl-prolyl isomerase